MDPDSTTYLLCDLGKLTSPSISVLRTEIKMTPSPLITNRKIKCESAKCITGSQSFFSCFYFFPLNYMLQVGAFPGGASSKEPAYQCRRHKRCGFDPWVMKILWRVWQSTPVFLPGELHEQRSLAGYSPYRNEESDTTEVTLHEYMHMLHVREPGALHWSHQKLSMVLGQGFFVFSRFHFLDPVIKIILY